MKIIPILTIGTFDNTHLVDSIGLFLVYVIYIYLKYNKNVFEFVKEMDTRILNGERSIFGELIYQLI
jgi:hypothetical protein